MLTKLMSTELKLSSFVETIIGIVGVFGVYGGALLISIAGLNYEAVMLRPDIKLSLLWGIGLPMILCGFLLLSSLGVRRVVLMKRRIPGISTNPFIPIVNLVMSFGLFLPPANIFLGMPYLIIMLPIIDSIFAGSGSVFSPLVIVGSLIALPIFWSMQFISGLLFFGLRKQYKEQTTIHNQTYSDANKLEEK